MKAHYSLRQIVLVVPFLAIFYFPISVLLYGKLTGISVDWNKSLEGLRAFPFDEPPAGPSLSSKTWFDKSFQKGFVDWWEGLCPGRAFFMRLFNQADYSLFSSSYMLQNQMIIGPHGQLNELVYVKDSFHQSGYNADSRLIKKLERLQAQLQQQGKLFLVVITPNKTCTYPDTVSPRFLSYDHSRTRPYDEFVNALEHTPIPFVDGARVIHEYAGKSPYPLFVRGGTHWDTYAAAQVLPHLMNKISELTHTSCPAPSIASVNIIRAAQSHYAFDIDLAEMLNVLWPPLDYDCPTVVMNYPPQPPGPKPRLILAGGSFCWQLLELENERPLKDRPWLGYAFYCQKFYEDFQHSMSLKMYESALASSDMLVLEINELLPGGTVDNLPAIIDESSHNPATSTYDISFAEGGNSAELAWSGFSGQEPLFRWTDGHDALLRLALPSHSQTYTLTAKARPFLYGTHAHQRVEIWVNGNLCDKIDLHESDIQTFSATFTASGMTDIDLHLPDAISPAQVTLGSDQRQLALAMQSVHISPTKNAP